MDDSLAVDKKIGVGLGVVFSGGSLAKAIGHSIQGWQSTRAADRLGLDLPMCGRSKVIVPEQVPLIIAEMKRCGWLPADAEIRIPGVPELELSVT